MWEWFLFKYRNASYVTLTCRYIYLLLIFFALNFLFVSERVYIFVGDAYRYHFAFAQTSISPHNISHVSMSSSGIPEAQSTDYLLWSDTSNISNNLSPQSLPLPPNYSSIQTTEKYSLSVTQPESSGMPSPTKERRRLYNPRGTLKLEDLKKYAADRKFNRSELSSVTHLVDRLEEWLVLELHKDGNRQYLRLTVRGLYRYVLNAMTDHSSLALQNAMKLIAITKSMQTKTRSEVGEAKNIATIHEEGYQEREDPLMMVLEETALPSTATASFQTMALGQEGVGDIAETTSGTTGENPANVVPISSASNLTEDAAQRPSMASTRRILGKSPAPDVVETGSPSGKKTGVTYRERLGGYLHPRDMRRLVTPFSTSNEPGITVRRHVMLLNFDPIRAIVLRDRLLVLVPEGSDALLTKLEQRVRNGDGANSMEKTVFGSTVSASGTDGKMEILNTLLRTSGAPLSTDPKRGGGDEETVQTVDTEEDESESVWDNAEFEELKGLEWANLPFELQCADAVLHEVGSMLSLDTFELQTAANNYIERALHQSHNFSNDDPLTIIRAVKDAVQQMSNRVQGFVKSMNHILDDDASMALMNLSRLISHPQRFIRPVTQRILDEESDEPELILEASLHIGTSLMNYLDLIQGQINTAKELVDQKQDAMRNRLLFADMMISVFALVVALASMIGSFFGMNVPNGWELKTTVFAPIVYLTLIGCALVCVFIMAVLWFSGTIPHTVRALSKDVDLKTNSYHDNVPLPISS